MGVTGRPHHDKAGVHTRSCGQSHLLPLLHPPAKHALLPHPQRVLPAAGGPVLSSVLAFSSVKVVQVEKGNAELCQRMCDGDNDCKRWVWVEKMLGSIPKTCLLDYRAPEGLEKA